MLKNVTYKHFFEGYLGIFLVFTLLLPKLIALAFIGFLPLIIVGFIKKKIKFKINYLALGFILLYLIYLIYASFTRHPAQAATYFENKLSFILLPILLSFRLKSAFSYQIPLTVFLMGLIGMLIQYYCFSFYCFSQGGGKLCFLTTGFSSNHHPTYTSVYLLFGIISLYFGLKQKFRFFNLKVIIPLFFLFALSYLLCLSLAGILFLFALLAILSIRLVYLKWGKITAFVFTVLAPFLMYFTIISIPQVEGEWTNAKWYFDEFVKNPNEFVKNRKYPMVGTEVRIVMWTVAYEVVKDYPMGVGTGNVDEVLTAYLNRVGQDKLAKHEYNPHNQYLQTWVETGLFGFLILLSICATGIYYAYKNKNWILLLLILNLAFNMIFESMLQRQDGIVFYTFVLNLLACYPLNKMSKS